VELHRVLKPTGSLYLHCDPTASHYLKVVMDAIFGPTRLRNEIVWKRTRAHNDRNLTRFGAVHDTILYYSKTDERTFNKMYMPRDESTPKTHDLYKHTDGKLYRKGDCRAPGGRGPRYEWNGHVQNWRFSLRNTLASWRRKAGSSTPRPGCRGYFARWTPNAAPHYRTCGLT